MFGQRGRGRENNTDRERGERAFENEKTAGRRTKKGNKGENMMHINEKRQLSGVEHVLHSVRSVPSATMKGFGECISFGGKFRSSMQHHCPPERCCTLSRLHKRCFCSSDVSSVDVCIFCCLQYKKETGADGKRCSKCPNKRHVFMVFTIHGVGKDVFKDLKFDSETVTFEWELMIGTADYFFFH